MPDRSDIREDAERALVEARETERALLRDAVGLLGHYAAFIRNHVKAADIEMHPYLPEIERVIEEASPTTASHSPHPLKADPSNTGTD